MRTYDIEPRDRWLQRIAASGVSLGSLERSGLWNERRCVELSASDAEALQAHAESFYHEMVQRTEEAIERRHLNDFDLTFQQKRIISRSWEMSDYAPTLFTRVDYAFDENGVPSVIALESGLTAGLIEAAIAQWHWLEESAPWMSQFNTISERLTSAWREYQLIGRMIHVGYDPRVPGEVSVAEYLWESASSAGVYPVATPLDALRIDDRAGSLVDSRGDRVDVLISSNARWRPGGADLWTQTSEKDVCLVEPHWKSLWDTPQWLAYHEETTQARLARGHTLLPVSNRSGRLICSVWIVAGEVSGVGFSQQTNGDRHHVREFIPHILVREGTSLS